MLIEFSVGNYRSFLKRKTLSMVPGSLKETRERHVFGTGYHSVPKLLQSSAVYGPNASGKSNLVMAIEFFQDFILTSANDSQEGDEIPVVPFRLTKKSSQSPCEFEAIFIMNKTRFQYGFSVDQDRVWDEWMFATPEGGRSQRWFERIYDKKTGLYDWHINPVLKGRRQVWKESTRNNALFFSTAIQLNSETLREPFSWVQDYLRVLTSITRLSPRFTASECLEEENKGKVLNFLKSADLGIDDLLVREVEINLENMPDEIPEELKETILKDLKEKKISQVRTVHLDDNGEAISFSMDDESDGTRSMFAISAPWLEVLEFGSVLVVDELHRSLHPKLLNFLVNLFHNKETNKNKAQLIFTAHDTSLMDPKVMDRDQFWFVDKDDKKASQLYPLSDFNPRIGEALERGYLGGRYGALPKTKEFA